MEDARREATHAVRAAHSNSEWIVQIFQATLRPPTTATFVMNVPPIPADEPARLTALRRYDVLDTPPEEEFDDLTRLASQICGTPIALISLVDAGRQWFKSRVGIEISETPREVAFCAYTILGTSIFEVPDTLEDTRFAEHPLVRGRPDIRFYAGAPLCAPDGSNIGSICVIDHAPRQLTAGQRDALATLGRQVMRQLELRMANARSAHDAAFRQAILDSAAASIISTTPAGIITTFSHGSEQLLGYTADEVVEKKTPEIIHDPAEVAARAHELTRELGREVAPGFDVFVCKPRCGTPETRGWTYIRKDGTRVPVLLSVSAMVDSNGVLMGFLGVARDITELKRAQADLEHAAAELSRSNSDLEKFAYIASHDLQEPLRMITSYLQLLKRRYKGQLDEQADQFIGFAVDGAARLQLFVRGLLTFARIGTGRTVVAPVDMNVPLDVALDNLKLTIAEKEAMIIRDPMPVVSGDAILLAQLFQNLISNSLKFCTEPTPRIHFSAKPSGDDWIFSIADNGIGIEPQFLDRIFAIFQRLHSHADFPGTGIGLALCKKIVDRHGGRIWVTSEAGKGSTFSFSLPAAAGKN